ELGRVLGELDPTEADEDALVVAGQRVGAGRLDLAGLRVQEQVPLPGRVLLDRDVDVEQAAVRVAPPGELAGLVLGVAERSLAQGTAAVDERVDVEHLLDAEAVAPRAHPGGVVEGERVGVPDRRRGAAGPQQAHPVADVGDRGERGARPAVQAALVDDDGGGQVLDPVRVRPPVGGQVVLRERREGRVHLPLGLRGDRVEDQRRLARAGDADDDDEGALGEVEVEAAEVVLADAPQADGVQAHGGSVPLVGRGGDYRRVRPVLGLWWRGQRAPLSLPFLDRTVYRTPYGTRVGTDLFPDARRWRDGRTHGCGRPGPGAAAAVADRDADGPRPAHARRRRRRGCGAGRRRRDRAALDAPARGPARGRGDDRVRARAGQGRARRAHGRPGV